MADTRSRRRALLRLVLHLAVLALMLARLWAQRTRHQALQHLMEQFPQR